MTRKSPRAHARAVSSRLRIPARKLLSADRAEHIGMLMFIIGIWRRTQCNRRMFRALHRHVVALANSTEEAPDA
jgi:hypothetical protein